MHKYILLFVFATLMSANLFAKDVKKYGKEITSTTEKVNVSELLKNPKNYEGKKVLVEGTILNVCEKRGCWIELSSDKEFESIRVKVKDGEIVFPMEAKGKTAVVEGEFYSFEVETDAECSGKECEDEKDKEKCNHDKKQVKTIYQIKGLGAEI